MTAWEARRLGVVAGIVLLWLSATPGTAMGQALVGRVLAEGGSPLPAATVEVWGRAEVLYVTHSGPRGYFSLPDLQDQGVTRYVFRYLGRKVQIVQSDEFHSDMVIELRQGPDYRMEGLEVSVRRNICPIVDEPSARMRWANAAAKYDQNTSSRGIGGFFQGAQRDMNENDILRGIDGDIRPTIALWESWPTGVRMEYGQSKTLESVVRTMGYVWEREYDGPELLFGRGRHLNWRYAALDTRSANHFATSVFGDLHTFSVLSQSESGLRLQFCPTEESRHAPYIRGTILLGEDDRMIEAAWRFSSRNPDEEAGGWVRFGTVPDPNGGPRHLVAERGMFFRHDGFKKPFPDQPRWLFRDLREWPQWVVSPTGQEPASGGGAVVRN